MTDHDMNNLKHEILYTINKLGFKAAEIRYYSACRPLSPKGRAIRRVFGMLHQDEQNNWFFPEKKET